MKVKKGDALSANLKANDFRKMFGLTKVDQAYL
jgi:hypothetical protein